MKKIAISLFMLVILLNSATGQVPEILRNDLSVSNAAWTDAVLDGIYYFQGHDGDFDYELWRTDGTPEGTYRVANINSAGSSYAGNLTPVGSNLFFTAANDTVTEQLYISDGTEQGTDWVANVDKDAMEQYHMLTSAGGLLYFRAYTPGIGVELWVSDGTGQNTFMVGDICEDWPSFPYELTPYGEALVFAAGNCLASNAALYITEGLGGGILQIGGVGVREILVADDDHIFFANTFQDLGDELASATGMPGSAGLVDDINPGAGGSNIYHLTQVDTLVFFRAYHADYGAELWAVSLNTNQTRLIKDINPGAFNSSFPSQLISFKNKLIFSANDGVHGEELWISDGTEEGTYMLKNISEEPGAVPYHSYPQKLFATEDLLFFAADDFYHGLELWQTDGTPEGTIMTADIWPSGNTGSDPGDFGIAGNYLVFNAYYNKRTLFRLELDNISGSALEQIPQGSSLELYPNPASDFVRLENRSDRNLKFELMDVSGKFLGNGLLPGKGTDRLDLSSLAPGLYIIRAASTDHFETQKLMVE